jgi:hypothetical protein
MAATGKVKILAKVDGLGELLTFLEAFDTETPVLASINRQVQATTATEEALNLCGVSTVELIVIKATSKDLKIDTSYAAATFSEEINVQEGEVAIFRPGGTVYILNEDTDETCTVDYMVVGSA